ncbi:abortive infection family protein [Glutamicibacter sp. NPDC087673]|uniref:abortive infection family protein n=2 Tax=Glutamicibacter TaxID=1742989 RepID=UPI00380495DB
MSSPLNDQIAGAIGQFFLAGDGPSHSVLTRVFKTAGMSDHDPYDPETQTPNKQQRVLAVASVGSRKSETARKLVDSLLNALRLHGSFSLSEDQQRVDTLRSALTHSGWGLTTDGRLEQLGKIDFETGGRAALDEQLNRLRRNVDDPAAVLGGAKELLEAIAKFVLEEGGLPLDPRVPFPGLIEISFERLGLLPAVVNNSVEGSKQIHDIYRSAKKIIIAVNELRNLQGTGHGRTLPTGVTVEAARYVIREATHVAELMLTTHDRQMGR